MFLTFHCDEIHTGELMLDLSQPEGTLHTLNQKALTVKPVSYDSTRWIFLGLSHLAPFIYSTRTSYQISSTTCEAASFYLYHNLKAKMVMRRYHQRNHQNLSKQEILIV